MLGIPGGDELKCFHVFGLRGYHAERARLFAYAWNAQFMDYGDCGHINADSGLASWPEGHVLLQDLMKD